MDFSIGNLNGTNASVSSMISQLIAKKTSSMNSLLEQRTSIENALASLQNSALGTGSINNSYSSQIASLQDTIDAMKNQYTINGNKLNTINSLNKSYNKTVSTLDDYINSLKNPNPNDSYVSGTSSNGNVAGVTVGNSANPQRVELSVTQLATCSVLKSGQILGTAISGKTKITDLFAGTYDSASNTITSLRTDITADMKLSEIGVTSGSFKLGSRVITVDKDESVGDLINKINSDSSYTAKIDKTTGAFTISATAGNSVAITNAVGDLNVSGDITTTTKLEDIGIKNGAYFAGGVQIDVAEGDTVASLIEKLEAEGFRATLQTDANNPSIKTLNITDSSGNKVNTEASNFASLTGFTVSEGTFSINGETFTIDSDTTIDDLVFQINKATADGVGATFKDGQIILTASKTGAVDIKVEKGTSNFTNAVGFTAGGVMNTGNLVMGSDGSYVALKGLNSGISYSDTAKADGSGKFKTGNFLLSYSKIDEDGNPTSEMLTTEIKIEDGDTVQSIIDKIKQQTSQKYTDAEGNEQTNYLQAEIVDGRFQIRQTAKGKGYNISVSAGSSDFTKYVGLTKDVNSGVSISGSSTTYTGINAVTSSTTFKEGNFSITASVANDPSRTETITFDVAENETLQSVMDKINNSGLAIKASLVTMSDGTQHLQLSHNNYGSGYKISVTSGSSDFTNVVGFTSTVSSGISTDGTNSTLTGTVGNLDLSKTGYTNGSFVISTNKLSADGKTPSSEMASAVIEVDSSMSLQDIMDKINSATYKDADGNDVNMGLRASLTADGKIQIKQVNGGEGFDIKIEAGDTNFTQEVGLTKSVSVGVSAGATSSYVLGTKVYDGTFTEGSFKVTTNKVGDDGNASSEMVSVDVKIEAGKTLAESLDSINAQLNSIGLSASIVAEGENAGKIKIEQLNAGSGFDIKIESGTTDFTEKVGLTTQVSTGVSNEGTYAYVKGEKALTETAGYSAGDFIVYTNKTDSEGNPLDEMQSVVVSLQAGLSAENAVKSINNQISSIGLSATIEDGKIKISQTNAGSGFDIKIEAGTTNFTEKAGLTKTVSVGTSTTGTASSITGNKVLTGNESAGGSIGIYTYNNAVTESTGLTAGADFKAGRLKITMIKDDGSLSTQYIDYSEGDTVEKIYEQIEDLTGMTLTKGSDNHLYFVKNNASSNFSVSFEDESGDFAQTVGLAAAHMTEAEAKSKGYITIHSKEELIAAIGDGSQTDGKSYILMDTIDFGGASFEGFDTFKGTLNGNGYGIANLTLTQSSSGSSGFFKTLDGATIENIAFSNITTSWKDKISASSGIVAGVASNNSVINNVLLFYAYATEDIYVQDGASFGIMVGELNDSTLENAALCPAYLQSIGGDSSNANAGLLVGSATNSEILKSTVLNVVFDNDLSYDDFAIGGVVGSANNTHLDKINITEIISNNGDYSNVYAFAVNFTGSDMGTGVSDTSKGLSLAFKNYQDSESTGTLYDIASLSIDNPTQFMQDVLGFSPVPVGNAFYASQPIVDLFANSNVLPADSFVQTGTATPDFTTGSFTITAGKNGEGKSAVITVESGDTVNDVIDKINNSGLDVTALIDENGKFVIKQNNTGSDYFVSVEAGNTNFTQFVGITANVTTGASNPAHSATLTGNKTGLTLDKTFTDGSFIITTNDVTYTEDKGYFADPTKILSTTIKVEEGDTLQQVLDKINQQGASIGISASLTDDGRIQIKQLNAGTGFNISVVGGYTNFTSEVGLTTETTSGVSSSGSYTNISGSNTVSGSDSANDVVYDYIIEGGNKVNSGDFATISGNSGITSGPSGVNHVSKTDAESQGYVAVSTADELISALSSGRNVMLMNDINMQGVTFNQISSYSGKFNGNGYFISNLEVNGNAMFANLTNYAEISNIGFINASVNGTGNAALIAVSSERTFFSNIYIKDSSIKTTGATASALVNNIVTGSNVHDIFIENTEIGGDNVQKAAGIAVTITNSRNYGYDDFYISAVNFNVNKNAVVSGITTEFTGYHNVLSNSYIKFKTNSDTSKAAAFVASSTQEALSVYNGISATNAQMENPSYFYEIKSFGYDDAEFYNNVSYYEVDGQKKLKSSDLESVFGAEYYNYKPNPASGASRVQGQFSAGDFTITVNHPDFDNSVDYTITVDEGDTLEDVLNKINNTVEALDFSIKDGKLYSASEAPLGLSVEFTSGSSNFVEYAGLNKVHKATQISEQEAASNGYIAIHSAQELIDAIGDGSATEGKTFVLMNDIDFSGINFVGFEMFNGTLDGNGFTIKNLNLDAIAGNGGLYTALFQNMDGAVVKNLTIKDVNHVSFYAGGGAVLGGNVVNSTFENIVIEGVSANNVNGINIYGGLAAYLDSSTVKDVLIKDVNVSVLYARNGVQMGGLAGISNNSNIEKVTVIDSNLVSYNYASSVTNYIGGLFGSAQYTNVFHAYVDAGLGGVSASYGQIAGKMSSSYIEMSLVNGGTFGTTSGTTPTTNQVYTINSSMSISVLQYWADHDSLKNYGNGLFLSDSLVSTFNELVGPGISTSLTQRTATANGQFNEGTFTITAGLAGSEVTKTIEVEGGDTIDDIITKINNSGLGVTASLTADGKFVINSDSTDANFRIKVESGSSDFLEYVGMVSETTSTGILSPGTDVNQFTTLKGNNYVTASDSISAGSFKINDITIDFAAGTIQSAIDTINSYTSQTGVVAELIADSTGQYNVVLRASMTGPNQTIFVDGGTSNFGSVSGLTTQSISTTATIGTDGSNHTITGSKTVYVSLTEEEALAQGYELISSSADLIKIRNATDGTKFILTNNINLSGYAHSFSITASNITIDGNGYGFFNYSSDSSLITDITGNGVTIKNLGISNFNIEHGEDVGLLIGHISSNDVTFSNIYIGNSTLTASGIAAGLVSVVEGDNITIKNVYVDKNVTINSDSSYAGGLVGYNNYTLDIDNVNVSAVVEGYDYAGGLIGYAFYESHVNISNSAYTGNQVVATYSYGMAGGLVGYNDDFLWVKNSFVLGSVISPNQKGVFVGNNALSDLKNSFYNQDYFTFKSYAGSVSQAVANNPNVNGIALSDAVFDKYFDNYISVNAMSFNDSTKISTGTVIVNGTTINLTSSSSTIISVDDAVSQINAKSSQTGVTAEIKNGKVVFTSDSAFTIAAGTSDFVQKTGTAGYTVNAATETTIGNVVSTEVKLDKITESEAISRGYTVIKTADEFFTKLSANPSGKYILMNDIDFSGASYAQISNFDGILEGNGYTIKNYTSSNALIYSTAEGAEIKNLHIDNAQITPTTSSYAAVLVRQANGSISFSNIDINNSSIGSSRLNYVGLLIGKVGSSGTQGYNVSIENVNIDSNSSIYGSEMIGALIGMNLHSGFTTVRNVTSAASITASSSAGGLIGVSYYTDSFFENVKSTGTITSRNTSNTKSLGGFIGSVYSTPAAKSNITFKDSYASVSIKKSDGTNYDTAKQNQFVGSLSGNVPYTSITYDNAKYNSSVADSTGEGGTAGSSSGISGYDANWSPLQVQLSESEALAQGYTVIHNASEFVSKINANKSGKFILIGDIDMSSLTSYTSISGFNGTLNGNGYKISSLGDYYATTPVATNGLFSSVTDGAKFKNIIIEDFTISGADDVGLLAGNVSGTVEFDNITIQGTNRISGGFNVGGVIGQASSASIFANNIYISDSTSISANSDAGGFIGFVANGSLIKLSNLETYAESVSVADAGAGGVIGESFDSSLIFSNVYANMYSTAVYTGNDYSGGIIGQVEFLSDSINIVFSNVYSETGLVDGGPSRGAVFGSLYGEDNPYFLNNTAYISSAYGGDDYAQSLSSSEFNAQLDRTEFYTDSYKYFQGNLTIKLGNNNPVNVVIDTSSLDELLEKLNTYGIDTTFDNGILTISSSSGFSISGTGNVLEILNLSAGNYYNKIQYGSVKGLTKDTKFDGLTSGYLKYGEGAATNSVYISSSDSLGSIIDKINNATSSSFEAGIDSLGRFYIKKLNNSSTSIVVSFTTTNLNNFIGIADNSSSQSNTAIESSSSTLSGSVNVTGNETLNAGSFTLMLGNVSRDFTVNQGETINKVLEKINNAGLALTASIKDGKVFILANDGNNDDINVIEYSGNFAELAGLKTALISEKTLSNNDLNTNCVAGDFNIEYNGNTYKINVENEKISSVLSKINALNIGLTASIVDNKVLIVANDPKGGNITFIDGTSDFTKKVGLSSGGEQSAVIDAGTNSTLTSANMVTSISGMYSSGDFSIHITDNNGNIISSEKITISSTDSINNIIDKINSSNAGVTAYVDGNTGKMVLQRNSSDTAGGILVTKGTSNFTNRIGFTSGGEQSVTTATGSQAELISTSASTGVQFTDGDFIIQMTDKSGNIVSKHEILVSSTDNVSDIVRKINDANIGLYAYIDSATDKMVIERNANTGEGGFVLQKGISDFTNKMGFTSGGNLVAQYEDGDIAIIKSDYDVNEAGTFTEGTFYIDGIEINITADDIASGNAVQAVLDRINDLTDVFASLDNQNRIVLTKKPSAGEGSIEIVKGTSDFTNKFGFTSGGYQTGVSHTGDNATLVSKDVSLNTVVSEGYFYIQRTGNNSTNPIRIDVAANSTIADVIDKINAVTSQTGVIASWDSSSNKIVLTRSGETGEGGFDVIKGTSNFTNIAGFTSGGELYVPICGGNMASVTGANKVAQNTVVSNGDFVIKLDNTEHVITLDTDTTIEAVMEKINAIDGLTAVYDDNTKKITITRDGASGAGSIEIIKGTSDFTNIAGFTSGGSQTATVVQGSKASITSVNKVDDTTKFTAGDFVINVKGETNKSININIDDDDTILSIVDKINADKDSGIFASFDAATGKITISLGAELGDSSIEIVKGSSNFTNVVGFTTGGSSNGVFQDGDTAEIISGNSAASSQHFTEGDFTIKLTGNVPAGQDSEFKINVTANDTLQTIVDKINALDKGVYAFINDDNKLVIRRDADYGSGGIEIIKGTSSFTTDMGITSGGEEFDSLVNAGSSSKIISTQDVATAEGAYTDGNFFIQLLDKNGNAQGGLIQVDINKTGNSVDSISTIINTINSMNAGVTASIENGKFVLTRNQDTEAGSLTVIKGTSDFTNVLGLTSGGNLQDGVYESGEAATNTVLTSKDLGKKLVSDSMTLGSIGVKNGTFKINGVDINVKASDTIYDLASRINSVFSNSAYEDIAVSASYENGELVLRSKNASSTARIVVEKGTTNFTDIAQLTRDYQNSVDLGIEKTGQNAHFNINGKDYDMALDLNDKGQNMIYLDDNGNVLDSSEGASIAINVKQTGNTTIDIGRNLLNDSVEKLQSFVNRFNTAMDAAANPIMSDDTAFNSFINQIKNALTNNIGSINKVTTKLAEIGIIVKITGGNNSNMGSVQISLSKTNGQYDYVEAFYKDPQKVLDLIIGDDSAPLDHNIAGSFVRLSDVLHNALENNRNGYFKITPRSIEAQQKALKREITSTTFDLNELKNTAAGTNEMQGLSEYLLQLEQQYQLINEAIIALNSQYSSSITRLVLNKNNASFKPLVS